ncbi:hypothetical protein A9Q74_16705 [Colwellia sp. 39_35_sub15_T18]|nr:hypothetical protein A9Q74_16705 [Colwellia sp. 39_35_sub15_T18]
MLTREEPLPIHQLLNKFEEGDFSLLDLISDNIDFRIDHYDDDTDIEWQQCDNKQDFVTVLQRLTSEVFPKGTKIINISSSALQSGWYMTIFEQQFFYAVREAEIFSRTFIISHEVDGKIDYFREHVTEMENI